MLAGDAIDVGNMKSSMFMGSGSEVIVCSTDSRSFAIPEGALVDCWLALRMRLSIPVVRTRAACPKTNVPCLLSLLSLQIHCHHPPSQIFQSFLVWQLRFGLAIKLPYLRSERILPLHLIGVAQLGTGGVVLPIRKEAVAEKVFSSLLVFGRDVYFFPKRRVRRGGWSLRVVRRWCLQ